MYYVIVFYRSKYNQAVRTLRATLNVQSRKEDGMFLRVEENFHVQFALKKVSCYVHVCMPIMHIK